MKYAVIKNSVVFNIVEAEPDFAAQMGWITFPDYVENKAVGIGWGFDGSNWIALVEDPVEDTSPEV